MEPRVLGYTVLRVVTGINMFLHGATRVFGDYGGFVAGVVTEFQGTILPPVLVRSVGWGIPVVELAIGVSLILGLMTTLGLLLGGLLMAVLVTGMGLLQNWGTVADQMLYTLIFALLLAGLSYNHYSIDEWKGALS